MKSLRSFALVVGILLSGALAWAQGTVIIGEPIRRPDRPQRVTTTPLDLLKQRILTEITDGVAVTRVEQTFRNPTNQVIEGTYVCPLPEGAAVGDFAMTVDGKKLRGEVLEKDRARAIYESIVRQMRDPGLLELLDARLYRASIAPLAPRTELKVELSYTQTLTEQAGMGVFQHPLRPAGLNDAIDQLFVQVRIKSAEPLLNVFCPTHNCSVSRPSDREATVTFEQARIRPERDFQLYYQRRDAQYGVTVLTHREPGEPGWFLLRVSPRIELDKSAITPKDIAFVVDVSGSMKGDKIEQARKALKFCINSLNTDDRFNIYTFSTDVRPFRDRLAPGSPDTRTAALSFVDKIEAIGGTNIDAALRQALKDNPRDPRRPYIVVFMTDGQPTVECTDPEQILAHVRDSNSAQVRLHVLGVGHDVNTHLLDKLAEMNRGSREYCVEGEDLELKMSAMVGRLTDPLLTDVQLVVEDLSPSDLFPRNLPDLFRGGELLVMGRYEGDGPRAVKLVGKSRGETTTLVYETNFPKRNDQNDFLPRLWANRKVAYLLDELRLHGRNSELETEVVALATRYGIVTPYTSSLILEDNAQRGDMPAPMRGMRRAAAESTPRSPAGNREGGGARGGRAVGGALAPASGREAVDDSRMMGEGKDKAALDDDEKKQDAVNGKPAAIRHIGDRTFVHDGTRYVDTTWDGKKETRKVKLYSDDYFTLLKQRPELKKFAAIGEPMVIVIGQEIIEFTSADSGSP